MKKFLPVILFLLGALTLVGTYFFVIKDKKEIGEANDEESALIEVSLEKRPVTSLTPSDDGHWLKLEIKKILIRASSLDYELLYKLPDGRIQGVPGTIKLEGQETLERDLLLGSESSGKFRYDEGVEGGTLTLRFRNEKGKLVAKFSTEFRLQSGVTELNALDGKFAFSLAKASNEFFVTMQTFGVPNEPPKSLSSGPYGVFSSSTSKISGETKLGSGDIYRWSGNAWEMLKDNKASDIGIFVETQG